MEKTIKTEKTKTKKITSATLDGFGAKFVEVESSFTKALPGFSIVGLGSQSIQESKERVKSALLNNDFEFPPLKIVINLSPSDLRKEGSHFDLPIALSILFHNKNMDLSEYMVLGELGLDGRIKDTNSIFPAVLSLRPKKVILPKESVHKVSKIPGIEIYPFTHLKEFFEFNPVKFNEKSEFNYEFIKIKNKKYYYQADYKFDFEDVKGQESAKEAALISAAGFHNILLEGSPGVGKSMIITRLKEILPPISLDEILEVEKLRAMEGYDVTFTPKRPFRSPHYSSTKSAIFGGGSKGAKIGEIAFANKGMLFFDELPYFQKDILENLRLPLQDRKVLISRVNSKIEYETDILFAAAMNPCPCGNLLSQKECRCTDLEIRRYKNRISEPLYDRIEVYHQMYEEDDSHRIKSSQMFDKILIAFEIQKGVFNANLPENYIFDADNEAWEILNKAIKNFVLSKRSEFNILKVAKTVANLEKRNKIKKEDIIKALKFRRRK